LMEFFEHSCSFIHKEYSNYYKKREKSQNV